MEVGQVVAVPLPYPGTLHNLVAFVECKALRFTSSKLMSGPREGVERCLNLA